MEANIQAMEAEVEWGLRPPLGWGSEGMERGEMEETLGRLEVRQQDRDAWVAFQEQAASGQLAADGLRTKRDAHDPPANPAAATATFVEEPVELAPSATPTRPAVSATRSAPAPT